MSVEIMKSDRTKQEQIVGRYMQEIRDIEKGGFSRRELLRMGLVAGGAGLAALGGMRSFRPYWAHAEDLPLLSPPNTPFVEPLYIPPAMTPVRLNPAPTKGTNLMPSLNPAVLDKGAGRVSPFWFTEALRPQHQHWEEFLPVDQYESVVMPVSFNFYPAGDGVPPSVIWTFVEAATGKVAPLRIDAHYGRPVIHRVHNALPVENHGFGINQISTHLHNFHSASESDGGPTHFYDARQFKDFHYTMARAGFASTHPTSTFNGRAVRGDALETQSFCWFHDHRMDFTAQNVYKGMASFYTVFSGDIDLDTGDETTGLRLPSGEFDIPIIIMDPAFDPTTGQLFFDRFNMDGILGDKYSVNFKIQPYLEVKRRKYRFRILDGGPSRTYHLRLSDGLPFIQISNDGNLLPRPLTRSSIRLAVAERVDVIVDFSQVPVGSKIYLQNRLEQTNGRGPTGRLIAPTDLLELRVVGPETVEDPSRVPDTMLPLPPMVPAVENRSWKLDRQSGVWTINNALFDPDVISAFPRQNTAEIWELTSGGGWQHPLHIHLEEFRILDRNGRAPLRNEWSRKDVVRMGQAAEGRRTTKNCHVFLQFRDFVGDYPMHCHNIIHEDHAMMIRFRVVP